MLSNCVIIYFKKVVAVKLNIRYFNKQLSKIKTGFLHGIKATEQTNYSGK